MFDHSDYDLVVDLSQIRYLRCFSATDSDKCIFGSEAKPKLFYCFGVGLEDGVKLKSYVLFLYCKDLN